MTEPMTDCMAEPLGEALSEARYINSERHVEQNDGAVDRTTYLGEGEIC